MTSDGAIRKLSDGFGQYRITIKCRRCGHARSSLPDALAALFTWETSLEEIARRMRCSQCEVRGECSISTELLRKPRRHNTHP